MRDVQSTSITNEQEKADSARAKPLFFSLCRFSPNHRCDCSAISYVDVDDDECSFSHSLIFRFFILATVGRIRQCGVRQAHQGIVEFVAHFVQLIFFFFCQSSAVKPLIANLNAKYYMIFCFIIHQNLNFGGCVTATRRRFCTRSSKCSASHWYGDVFVFVSCFCV
jgi:hypothetical protein